MATVRKNQSKLTRSEWTALINAMSSLRGVGAPVPQFANFIRVHVNAMSATGMAWSVHSMPGMIGRNFLAWHRQYLLRFEKRLQQVDPSVALPYWDPIASPRIPQPLTGALVSTWGLSREWDAAMLPTRAQLNAAKGRTSFDPFQRDVEQVHNSTHRAVGGTMATASSPADPLFWLHHANIDRIWADWQRAHQSARPSNGTERLQPSPLFGVTVSKVLSVTQLGYSYA